MMNINFKISISLHHFWFICDKWLYTISLAFYKWINQPTNHQSLITAT